MRTDDLNKEQQQAVEAGKGNHLVLAGAGSGKTRVLVHRIAWLIQQQRVFPDSILAVTFTNKAAREMKERVTKTLGHPSACHWIGTFHSICLKLLRFHYKEAGLIRDFQVIDSAEQKTLIKRVVEGLNLDDKRWPTKTVQSYINSWKEQGLRSHQVRLDNDWAKEKILQIYIQYEKVAQQEHLVDFAELLLRTYEMLSNNSSLQRHYHRKFRHILIDEFQDTNRMQCALIQLLKSKDNQVMAVGDEDQSIYSWRGARVENILNFNKLFPNTSVHYLEQNYRSTNPILEAANAVISHNKSRLGKKLWTNITSDEPIHFYQAIDDEDEVCFVVDTIKKHQEEGNSLADCAVFYRVNALSRIFEEKLVHERIPYRIYGGLRFYDRAEIKHTLAYMRLIANRHSYDSFIRIVNMPRRGIGSQTLENIIKTADTHQLSLWQATKRIIEERPNQKHLSNFIQLIDSMDSKIEDLPLGEKTAYVIKLSGLNDFYKATKDKQSCLENLAELVHAASAFSVDKSKETMAQFLNNVNLEAGGEQAKEYQDAVQLMTVHSAKGLEFPIVFMVGMEDGLFPLGSASIERDDLEEERRLCYVGITRAKRTLYLSCAEVRLLYGNKASDPVSRFVEEIPPDLLHQINVPKKKVDSFYPPPLIKMGQRVMHSSFGYGVVKGMDGEGEFARVNVDFETEGQKWLVLQYANLQLL